MYITNFTNEQALDFHLLYQHAQQIYNVQRTLNENFDVIPYLIFYIHISVCQFYF